MIRNKAHALNGNERAIIQLSIKILEDARDRCSKESVDTVPVRLALRSLRPYLPEQWPLNSFWDGISAENELGRSASCTASLNGVRVELDKAGIKV